MKLNINLRLGLNFPVLWQEYRIGSGNFLDPKEIQTFIDPGFKKKNHLYVMFDCLVVRNASESNVI